MQKIAMPGSGFIARFYADSLQGYRNKDKIVSVYSRKKNLQRNFLKIMMQIILQQTWKK